MKIGLAKLRKKKEKKQKKNGLAFTNIHRQKKKCCFRCSSLKTGNVRPRGYHLLRWCTPNAIVHLIAVDCANSSDGNRMKPNSINRDQKQAIAIKCNQYTAFLSHKTGKKIMVDCNRLQTNAVDYIFAYTPNAPDKYPPAGTCFR